MIFVTVGTHEQPFNRLIKKVDELVAENIINEEVTIQTGFSTYLPEHCRYKAMFSYDEMQRNIEKARIIITHGGPSSFIEVLRTGKIPIVVPRLKKYGEHVNDHQLEFVEMMEKTRGNILPVYNIDDLGDVIVNYKRYINDNNRMLSNNKKFIKQFKQVINEMFKKDM